MSINNIYEYEDPLVRVSGLFYRNVRQNPVYKKLVSLFRNSLNSNSMSYDSSGSYKTLQRGNTVFESLSLTTCWVSIMNIEGIRPTPISYNSMNQDPPELTFSRTSKSFVYAKGWVYRTGISFHGGNECESKQYGGNTSMLLEADINANVEMFYREITEVFKRAMYGEVKTSEKDTPLTYDQFSITGSVVDMTSKFGYKEYSSIVNTITQNSLCNSWDIVIFMTQDAYDTMWADRQSITRRIILEKQEPYITDIVWGNKVCILPPECFMKTSAGNPVLVAVNVNYFKFMYGTPDFLIKKAFNQDLSQWFPNFSYKTYTGVDIGEPYQSPFLTMRMQQYGIGYQGGLRYDLWNGAIGYKMDKKGFLFFSVPKSTSGITSFHYIDKANLAFDDVYNSNVSANAKVPIINVNAGITRKAKVPLPNEDKS